MGGGKKYYKSEKQLYYKHKQTKYNDYRLSTNRWMKHMINSLYEVNFIPSRLNDKNYTVYK